MHVVFVTVVAATVVVAVVAISTTVIVSAFGAVPPVSFALAIGLRFHCLFLLLRALPPPPSAWKTTPLASLLTLPSANTWTWST